MASIYNQQTCCGRIHNAYHNDYPSPSDNALNALGGLMHDGWEFDAVPTVDTSNQCAYSDAWGHGFWLHDDTGANYNYNLDVPNVNQFLHFGWCRRIFQGRKLAGQFLQGRM